MQNEETGVDTGLAEPPGDAGVGRLAGEPADPVLQVRRQATPGGAPVIYVHGATFPSALSVFYPFHGRTWADDLWRHGFDVWAFDFAGYGGSERPFDSSEGDARPSAFGRSDAAAAQLGRVADFVAQATGRPRVSLIAHSWGSIVAGRLAATRPEIVDRLVLFGPIAQRGVTAKGGSGGPTPWRRITVADQLARFVADVPPGHPSVLLEPDLAAWGPAYLASDPGAAARKPTPAVLVPPGPALDIAAAFAGALPYDPSRVQAPTLVVRGAWDSLCTDGDAAWLMGRLGAREKLDVKIPAATHLMHLETGRDRLFEETRAFLGR